MAMSSDGRWAAVSTGPGIGFLHRDQRLRIFDARTGGIAFDEVHGEFLGGHPATLVFRGPDELAFGVRVVARDATAWAWAPDRPPPIREADYDAQGTRYVTGGQYVGERTIRLHDTASGKQLQAWKLPSPGTYGVVYAWIAGGGDRAIAWGKGSLYWCIPGMAKPERITDALVNAPVFGPDGDAVLVLAHDGGPATLYRADGSSASWICPVRSYGRVLVGRWLVHGEKTGEVRVRDAATGNPLAQLRGLPDLTFSIAACRGSRGVVATTQDGRTAAWDLTPLDGADPRA
ncbi:MAG: hypothetical protein ABMB14_29490 [Myxococcota bacterium]